MSTPERNRRPAESAFKQQKLKAWQPILSPKWVISSFLAVGVVFIAIGIPVLMASNQVLSVSVRYDELCKDQAVCTIEFDLSDDDGWEDQDVYVYYQLDNFYQNHRRYVQSRAAKQLTGETLKLDSTDVLTSDGSVTECSPFFDHSVDKTDDGEDKEVYMYPCGLVARSFFNDSFILRGPDAAVVQYNDHDGNKACTARTAPLPCPSNPEGIAWQSDVDKKYKAAEVPWLKRNCKYIGGMNLNYSGFTHPDMATIQTRATTGCDGPEFCGLRVLQDDGVTPNNGIYNCWHNVSDQDFIVWMRIAALPSFKKLHRKIPKGTLTKNSKYTFEILNNFPVHQFKGKKHVVLSTTTWIGGQNDFLGYSYVVVGGICVVLALLFLGKHMVSPRIMGDTKYLQWK